MKRYKFKEAVERYHKGLVRKLLSNDFPEEVAQDAVQNMVRDGLRNKVYERMIDNAVDGRIRKHLGQAATWQAQKLMKQQDTEHRRLIAMEEFENEDENATAVLVSSHEPTVDDIESCPFCHVGVLNQYKACGACNTILGQGRNLKEVLDLEEVTLAEWPDLGMMADVKQAMEKLTPLEKKLVEHVIHGNDTLEDMTELTGVSRSVLGRIFVEAKRKLRQELYEYAPESLQD